MKYATAILVLLMMMPVSSALVFGPSNNLGLVDEDGDGYDLFEDCNDQDEDVNPGIEEDVGDGIDNDCDGIIDPELPAGWVQFVDSTFSADGIELTDGADPKLSFQAQKAAHSKHVPITEGKTYTAQATVSCAQAVVEVRWFSRDGDALDNDNENSAAEGDVSVTAVAPEDAATAQIFLKTGNNACTFDDIVFVQGDTTEDVLPATNGPAQCCGADACWDGNKCVGDEIESSDQAREGNLGCVAGGWEVREDKFEPDRSDVGFCPRPTDCLLDIGKDPACVVTGEFDGDNYCEDGVWSTRTKFVAQQLIAFAEGAKVDDYTLFCDQVEPAFGFGEVLTLRDTGLSQCEGDACFNNVCLLQYADKTAFGLSLNADLDDTQRSVLALLDLPLDICNDVLSAGADEYRKCDATPHEFDVYYNAATHSLITIPKQAPSPGIFANFRQPQDGALGAMQRALDAYFGGQFVGPNFQAGVTGVLDFIFGEDQTQAFDTQLTDVEFFKEVSSFDRVYLRQKGEQKIFAFYERKFDEPGGDLKHYIGYNFENFNFQGRTPCDFFLAEYAQDRGGFGKDLQCDDTDSNSIVLIAHQTEVSNPAEGSDFIRNWVDVTAKQRLE